MKYLYIISLCLALTSCSTPAVIAQKDSVRIEYRERVVKDTAYLKVPLEVEKVVTCDTVSYLENNWASSEARVEGGFLSHSLRTKDRTVSVPCYVTVRDTVVMEKEQKVVEVERNLTWWERMWITCGKMSAGVLLLLFLLLLIRRF